MKKIKAVRVYQSVNFGKKQETFFSTIPIPNKVTPEITLNEKLAVVELKSSDEHVLVPLTNVSGIYLWTDKDDIKVEEIAKEKIKASKTGVRPSEIKRPI